MIILLYLIQMTLLRIHYRLEEISQFKIDFNHLMTLGIRSLTLIMMN